MAPPEGNVVAFDIYKRGQGKYTRVVTFVAGTVIGLLVARYVWEELRAVTNLTPYVVYGVPLVIFGGVLLLMAWVVNRPRSADFMIATEGEMKKVSIATTLIMAVLLWTVDQAFYFFFSAIGVLQIGGD